MARHLYAGPCRPRRSQPPRARRHAGPHLEHEFPSLGRRPRRPAGASRPRPPAGSLVRDWSREAGGRALSGCPRARRRSGSRRAVRRRPAGAHRGGPEPRHRRFRRGEPGRPRGRASAPGPPVAVDPGALLRRRVASKVIRRESRSTRSSRSRMTRRTSARRLPRGPQPPRRGCRRARGSSRREGPAARRRGA